MMLNSFFNTWAPLYNVNGAPRNTDDLLQHTATHCNTLQHTATHCNTLQHTAAYCNCSTPTNYTHASATHCNTLHTQDNLHIYRAYRASGNITTSRYVVASMSRRLRIIGLFCKEPYKRDHILQKRPIISRRLLILATSHAYVSTSFVRA